jgi:hypothetical protein
MSSYADVFIRVFSGQAPHYDAGGGRLIFCIGILFADLCFDKNSIVHKLNGFIFVIIGIILLKEDPVVPCKQSILQQATGIGNKSELYTVS